MALPHYYFGSKEKLFVAVFDRRAKVLNDLREAALNEALAAARPEAPSVEAIIRAYVEPLFKGPHLKEPGWKSYYALVAYVNNTPGWGGRLMTEHFDPLIRKFLDALRLALPGMNERDLFWGYHCFSGADAGPCPDRPPRHLVQRSRPVGRPCRCLRAYGAVHHWWLRGRPPCGAGRQAAGEAFPRQKLRPLSVPAAQEKGRRPPNAAPGRLSGGPGP